MSDPGYMRYYQKEDWENGDDFDNMSLEVLDNNRHNDQISPEGDEFLSLGFATASMAYGLPQLFEDSTPSKIASSQLQSSIVKGVMNSSTSMLAVVNEKVSNRSNIGQKPQKKADIPPLKVEETKTKAVGE